MTIRTYSCHCSVISIYILCWIHYILDIFFLCFTDQTRQAAGKYMYWTLFISYGWGEILLLEFALCHCYFSYGFSSDSGNCYVYERYMSRIMGFPTMWYVRPAKAQSSLRIRAVWSEALLVPWMVYECQATDCTSFGVSKLKRRLHRLVWVYTRQNDTLLEISWHSSIIRIWRL